MMMEKKDFIQHVGVVTEHSGVLINLSNHPVGKWSEKQRKAAAAYGHVMDTKQDAFSSILRPSFESS